MIRTAAAPLVDAIINHPAVRPTAQSGSYRLESAALLADGRNVCFGGPAGVFLFVYAAEGIYNGHVFLLPRMRGATGLAAGRDALRALFTRYRAIMVRAAVPLALPAARLYVRRLGFTAHRRDANDEHFVIGDGQWVD